jgi:ribosomal protein L10
MYSCLKKKKDAALNIATVIKTAKIYIICKFTKITAKEMDIIRKDLRTIDSTLIVLKNTILKLVLKSENKKNTQSNIQGQLLLVATKHDSKMLVKKLYETNLLNKVQLVFASFYNKPIELNDITRLATVPSFTSSLYNLIYALAVPLRTVIQTICYPITRLLFVLTVVNNRLNDDKKI